MGGRQSGSDPLQTCWSPFGFAVDPNRPKTGPPVELFKQRLLSPIQTLMNFTINFQVHLDPLQQSAGRVC